MNRTRLVVVSALAALSIPAWSLAQQFSLATGFVPDPQQGQGVAGGPVAGRSVQGNCNGYIPAQPQHVLMTQTGFRFLRVTTGSADDTTLLVRGTMGTWCDDDTFGRNPSVDLQNLPPGRYDIYVGTYAPNRPAPYQILFSELPSTRPPGFQQAANPGPTPQPAAQSSIGSLDIASAALGRRIVVQGGFSTVNVTGRNGGSISASGVRGTGVCNGYFQGPPSHILDVGSPQSFLRVYAVSAADSTMVIRRPDGQILCNDDAFQLNPSIEGAFGPGTYQIWVGAYRPNESRPYRLTVTTDQSQHP